MRGILAALLVLGCGDDTVASPDAPTMDAPRIDAPMIDAAIDAPIDALPDSAPDAHCASAAWTIEQLASVGQAPSLVFDPQGTMHVAFTTGYLGSISYGQRPIGGAFTTTVLESGQGATSTAIAVDSNLGVHVAFQDATDAFRYAYKPAGGSFTTQLVQSPTNIGADQIISIALDANDKPHLAFEYASTQVKNAHAYQDGAGNWIIDDIEGVGSAAAGGPRIAMNGTSPRVAYPVVNANLRYAASAAAGSWSIEQLPTHAEDLSLALDPGGTPHLIYAGFNGTADALLHSVRSASGTWNTETAALATEAPATCAAGCFITYVNSLTMDSAGGLHASYAQDDRASSSSYNVLVRYAYRAPGGGWTSEYIDGAGAYAGVFNAIALDPDGGVHVLYSRATTNTGTMRLMHAYRCR